MNKININLLNIFKKKNTDFEPENSRNALEQDIKASCEWVIRALNSFGYKADYTLESMKEVDRFFDEQNTPDGILSNNRGQILFALASYIGETVIKLYGGKWVIDENNPNNEINMAVPTNSGTVLWPAKRCMRRYTNGAEDSIYAYVYVLNK